MVCLSPPVQDRASPPKQHTDLYAAALRKKRIHCAVASEVVVTWMFVGLDLSQPKLLLFDTCGSNVEYIDNV